MLVSKLKKKKKKKKLCLYKVMIFTIFINRKIDKHEMPLNICFNWIQFFRCETNITLKNLVVIQLQAKGYNMDHKIK
jgi:hypothetical protein